MRGFRHGMNMKRKPIIKILAGAMLGFLFAAGAQAATQATIAQPGCDADIYNVHINRSILEARREVVMNQRYILKPDSVLEYTCFASTNINTSLLGTTARRAGPLFSESDLWAPKTIPLRTATRSRATTVNFTLGSDSLDLALAALVRTDTLSYINANFWHSYLGGTGPDIAPALPCPVMAPVWQAAKCYNFQPGTSLWLTFPQLVNSDPRIYPSSQQCNNTAITQAIIDDAYSANTAAREFSIPRPYISQFLTPGVSCTPGIVYTGVTTHIIYADARVGQLRTYPDAFCLTPGCTLKASGGSATAPGTVQCQ